MAWFANPERYEQMLYRYCGRSGLPRYRWVYGTVLGTFRRWIHSEPCCVKHLI